ncbi:hypothetical protein TI39_contig364g00027 [Zymoseptoria brevis]|uniref:Pentatricopeptide repeat domain-containing protein n=1 Tax=Zymoseptoria brevis TaxID=1047168 RepID=A0A0F4GQF4_9PEZI|nr:hypothetical protein TI39_contig364g00027 [Zymoseptoria brevis]
MSVTFLLARSRKAATLIWNSGQRSTTGKWQCSECRRAGRALGQQRRGYSEDRESPAGNRSTFQRDDVQEEDFHESQGAQYQVPGNSPRADGTDGQSPPTESSVAEARRTFWQNELKPRNRQILDSESRGSDETDEERDKLWEQFDGMDGGSSASDNPNSSRQERRRTTDLKDSVHKEDLSAALLDLDADAVAQCLLTAIRLNDLDFVRDIPKTTFSEIIRCLDARHFVAELGNIHVDLSTVAASSMNVAPMREVAFEYASVLRQVLAIRRAAGIGGTLADSRTLLRCARDLGNRKMAELIWSDLMSQRLTPDIQCYNYYMSATVWNGMHLAGFRQKVRVIPFFQMARKSGEYKDRRYKDYSVGENGVLESTMRIFNEMVARNIAADEESFRILIVAAAREGDMKTVKAILKRVWSIDVDVILASGDTPETLPKPMPTNSPLYPQSTLLFTIAHAFGINNDVSAAIRLVDFVARHYRLQISKDVWGQLFEWTFVLSIRRRGTSTNDGSREGQITSDSVQKLWQTMTGPPYFVKPTMGMYNYMIKSLFLRQMSGRIADLLNDEVRGLYAQQRKQTRFLFSSLKHSITSKDKAMGFRRRRWELQDLVGQRNNFWIRRWIRLLLGSFNHTYRLINIKEQYARSLPRLLWNWRALVPTNVRYETPTGLVQLEFRSEQELIDAGLANYASKLRMRKMLEPTARVVGESWTQRTPHLTRRLAEATGVQYVPQTHTDVVNRRGSRKTKVRRPLDV